MSHQIAFLLRFNKSQFCWMLIDAKLTLVYNYNTNRHFFGAKRKMRCNTMDQNHEAWPTEYVDTTRTDENGFI